MKKAEKEVLKKGSKTEKVTKSNKHKQQQQLELGEERKK
jgi:hypothetical protein